MRIAIFLLLLCGLLACVPSEVANSLSLDRHALLEGELWRLWTGHLVHFSLTHAAADIALLAVVAAIAQRELGGWATDIALLASAPLISLGLIALVPDLAVYRGASALSVFLGVIGGTRIWRRAPDLRFAVGCVGTVAAAKTWLDAAGLVPGLSSVPDGVRVAWQAHVMACLIAAAWMTHKGQEVADLRTARCPEGGQSAERNPATMRSAG
jgi:rhomboid family GlyGly-CTERM serine protease